MKHFLFLYPIKEYFEQEINDWSYGHIIKNKDRLKNKGINSDFEITKILTGEFREKGKEKFDNILNTYRNKDYQINFLMFEDRKEVYLLNHSSNDNLLDAGITFKQHTTQNPDGTYTYPSNDYIFSQLNDVEKLVIGGFHLHDCVKKVDDYAKSKGIETYVDRTITNIGLARLALMFHNN